MPFDFNEYITQRNKEVYDEIKLRILKGDKDLIKKAAAAENKSVNEYIVDAINEHEQRKSADFQPVRHKLERKGN